MFEKKKKYLSEKVKRIAAFSRLLRDCSITPFRILIKYIGTNFLSMEVFKEFVLDLMLEAVDSLSRFYCLTILLTRIESVGKQNNVQQCKHFNIHYLFVQQNFYESTIFYKVMSLHCVESPTVIHEIPAMPIQSNAWAKKQSQRRQCHLKAQVIHCNDMFILEV